MTLVASSSLLYFGGCTQGNDLVEFTLDGVVYLWLVGIVDQVFDGWDIHRELSGVIVYSCY